MNIIDSSGVSKQKALKLPFIELSFSHVSHQTDFDQYKCLHRQCGSLFTLMPFELNVLASSLLASDLHFRDCVLHSERCQNLADLYSML